MDKELPSISHLAKQLSDFDSEVINILEKELLSDGELLGKTQFFIRLLDNLHVFARKNLASEPFIQEAITIVSASIILLGKFPALKEDQLKLASNEANSFKPKNPDAIKQIKACDMYIRSRFASASFGSKLVLAQVIDSNEILKESYNRLFLFYKKLHGDADSITSLSRLMPASLTISSVKIAEETNNKNVVFFPPPKSYSLLNLDKDYSKNWIKNIELGKISFRSDKNSGWFDQKYYAYSSLLQPKVELSKEEIDSLQETYKQFVTNSLSSLKDDDNYPIPVFYHRLSQAYSFLLDSINEVFENSARNLRREGQNNHLVSEIKNMIQTFYGLYILSEKKLGLEEAKKRDEIDSHPAIAMMKSSYKLKEDTFSKVCESNPEKCLQSSLQWELFLP